MTTTPTRPSFDWNTPVPAPFTRESSIRLDKRGKFWHNGNEVEHAGLERAMHAWIKKHPENKRFVLENGYDWCYLTVDCTPFLVVAIHYDEGAFITTLSDGTRAPLLVGSLRLNAEGDILCDVKLDRTDGPYEARFDTYAATQLSEWLTDSPNGFTLQTPLGTHEITIIS